jgi:hypothetical protein
VTLALPDISRIALSVASRYREALTVVNVATTEGGGERVEILVTLSGCHDGECRVMVNVSRADRQTFEAEFRSKLRAAIDKHASGSSGSTQAE